MCDEINTQILSQIETQQNGSNQNGNELIDDTPAYWARLYPVGSQFQSFGKDIHTFNITMMSLTRN